MIDKMKCGGVKKFVVIPLKYLNRLSPIFQQAIQGIDDRITKMRLLEGKNVNSEYIVINTDEPYIQEIIEVMKKHNHWG